MRGFLGGNLTLSLAVIGWFLAQVLKTLTNLITTRELDWKRLVGSGGMPSSHSAFVCAATTAIGVQCGLHSPEFALAVVVSLVVMYDACNVRRAAGEQAKVLNYMMKHLDELSPTMMEEGLKELLGHTPLQVVMGAILGIAVGLAGTILL